MHNFYVPTQNHGFIQNFLTLSLSNFNKLVVFFIFYASAFAPTTTLTHSNTLTQNIVSCLIFLPIVPSICTIAKYAFGQTAINTLVFLSQNWRKNSQIPTWRDITYLFRDNTEEKNNVTCLTCSEIQGVTWLTCSEMAQRK